MTTRLELSNRMAECPDCWGTFIRYIQNKHYLGVPWHQVEERVLDDELDNYNAKAYFGEGKNYGENYVQFASEEDLVSFVMRWS